MSSGQKCHLFHLVNTDLSSAQCMQIVTRMERLSLAKEEYLVLKALVLVNSDAHVDEFPPLKQLRDQVTAALQDCVAVIR